MSDTESGCIVPLVQAGVIGLLTGLLALSLGVWNGTPSPGWPALAAGCTASLFTFISGVVRWRSSEYGAFPVHIPQDTSQAEPGLVRLELSENDGRNIKIIELPADNERLQVLADGLLNGSTLSEASWTGTGGIFTRSEFARLRDEMIRRGLARWNNPSAPARGAALTPAGRAVMRKFAITVEHPALSKIDSRLKRR